MDRKVKRALLSVTDKSGLAALGRALEALGVELVSTGGTAAALREAGVAVREVADLTGAPEMLDGRVKTLHPRVHGGILADRDNVDHQAQVTAFGLPEIDLVVVNLYRFEDTVARPDVTRAKAVANIDIGGPTMIRAAAKNHRFVAVVTDPADYEAIVSELRTRGGCLSERTRRRLAARAFRRTADYDEAIATWLAAQEAAEEPDEADAGSFPPALSLRFERTLEMRYGENPHQPAALYRQVGVPPAGWFRATLHQGKPVSFNNLVDLEAAVALATDLRDPACVIVKHTNPCGAASAAPSLHEAWVRALETDPQSAFGGIVALSGEVDEALAAELAEVFLEVIVAPSFSEGALARLARKKNLRVVSWQDWGQTPAVAWKQVTGGLLAQTSDRSPEEVRACRVVTKRAPSEEEWAALDFAWRVVKHVKSNAIVVADGRGLVGVGAGQMSRVDSTEIALTKARRATAGCVLASDAFFPFRDSIDRAAAAGIRAIVQPGGSIRDAESIAAADEHDLAMVLTDVRHFRH